MSYHSLRAQSRPRSGAPEPREYAIVAPSALQVGFKYSPGCVVTARGSPPFAVMVQSLLWLATSQLENAMVLPSGDHAGENSPGVNESGVRRFGFPLGKSISHSL